MDGISGFNSWLSHNRRCGECPMAGRVFVGADSDDGGLGFRPVMFIGLNPGNDEARSGRPFTGPAGSLLRSAIGGRGGWAFMNSILCHSANASMISGESGARASCKGNLAAIWKAFMPVVAVPCGNGAQSLFNIPDGITRSQRHVYWTRSRNGRLTLVAPIVHPSAILRNGGRGEEAFRRRVDFIFDLAARISGGPDFGFNVENFIECGGRHA